MSYNPSPLASERTLTLLLRRRARRVQPDFHVLRALACVSRTPDCSCPALTDRSLPPRSPNIPLSASSTTLPLSDVPAALAYVPPHPQNGTPYHRYTTLLLEQPTKLELAAEPSRLGFSVRDFVEAHGLKPAGVSFFRQKWDKDVSAIYSEVLGAFLPLPGPMNRA